MGKVQLKLLHRSFMDGDCNKYCEVTVNNASVIRDFLVDVVNGNSRSAFLKWCKMDPNLLDFLGENFNKRLISYFNSNNYL
jgi:hypothetical protein